MSVVWLIFTASNSAVAEIIVSAVLDKKTSFTELAPRSGTYISLASLSTGEGDELQTDFSQIGSEEIVVRFQTANRIEVSFPEEGNLTFGFSFGRSFSHAGSHRDISPSVSVQGVLGDAFPDPTEAGMSLSGPTGDRFSSSVRFNIPAGFYTTFDSLTISSQVPVEFDTDFSTDSPLFSAIIRGTIGTDDPIVFGQFVNIVPESHVWLLLFQTLVLLSNCRFR